MRRLRQAGEPLAFDFPLPIAAGPKFYGEQVRSEGPERRFVYIAVGKQAGAPRPNWNRRMKIDMKGDLSRPCSTARRPGKRLVGTVPGTGRDGTPACATVPVNWRLA